MILSNFSSELFCVGDEASGGGFGRTQWHLSIHCIQLDLFTTKRAEPPVSSRKAYTPWFSTSTHVADSSIDDFFTQNIKREKLSLIVTRQQ